MNILRHQNESPNAVSELIRIFSALKDFLRNHDLTNQKSIHQMYLTLLDFELRITEFYFEHPEDIGDTLTRESDYEDDDGYQKENTGRFAKILSLLQNDLYEYKNPAWHIQLKNFEGTLTASDIFVTVPYQATVIHDTLPIAWENNDTTVHEAIIRLFNTFKAQLLREVNFVTQSEWWKELRDSLTAPLADTMKLLSFDISNQDHETHSEEYETIETILDHVYAENPLYSQNIYLGYDVANRKIQTLAEKTRIKDAIRNGDESERLQKRDNEISQSVTHHLPQLRLLTNQNTDFETIVLWHLKDHANRRLIDLGLHLPEHERTIAQKRNYVYFKRIVADIQEKCKELPEWMMLEQMNTVVWKFMQPYKKILDKKRHLNWFYVPSFPKKQWDRHYSEKLVSWIAHKIIGKSDRSRHQPKEKSNEFAQIIDTTESFIESKRQEEYAILKQEGEKFFWKDANLNKILITATVRWYGGDDNDDSGIIAELFWMSWEWKMEDIGNRFRKYNEVQKFYHDTKKELLDAIEPSDRIAKLFELEKQIQSEHNNTFVFTKKNVQELFFATLLTIFRSVNYRWVWIDEKGKKKYAAWMSDAHAGFTGLAKRLNFPTDILDKAYQQLYSYYRAKGLRDAGHYACLLFIRDQLSKNIKFDLDDIKNGLQQMYDFDSKSYYSQSIQKGRINQSYLSLAKWFGVKLTLRRLRTLEDHYINMIHKPERLKPIDFMFEDDYRHRHMYDPRLDDDNPAAVEKRLQHAGSLMIPEIANIIDIRQHNEIPQSKRVDIDTVVPIAKNLPKLRFVCRGYRTDQDILEGNYIVNYNTSTQQLELTFDTTVWSHLMIIQQHKIEPTAVLWGGYATITKEIQHILLESYMAVKLHEPRIISAVAFKNAFKSILPNAKIIIGDDGMQNEKQYRKDELGDKYKDKDKDEDEQAAPNTENTWEEEKDDLPF